MLTELLLPISLGILLVAAHLHTEMKYKKGSIGAAVQRRKSSIFWLSTSTWFISELYSLSLISKKKLHLTFQIQTQCWVQRQAPQSLQHARFEKTELFRQNLKRCCNVGIGLQIESDSNEWNNPYVKQLGFVITFLPNLFDFTINIFFHRSSSPFSFALSLWPFPVLLCKCWVIHSMHQFLCPFRLQAKNTQWPHSQRRQQLSSASNEPRGAYIQVGFHITVLLNLPHLHSSQQEVWTWSLLHVACGVSQA